MSRGIGVAPEDEAGWMGQAVVDAGGRVVSLDGAEALIWYGAPADLQVVLKLAPHLRWIQLPSAGVESYLPLMRDGSSVWTAAKGVYAEPCAEHALGLAIAGFRHLDAGARWKTLHRGPAKTLFDAHVTIVGAGGISEEVVQLLRPFRVTVTVVRRRPGSMPGVMTTVLFSRLLEALGDADLVVLAAPLTQETEGMIAERQLRAMKHDAWLVNVARGKLINADDLVRALQERWIGGAGLDVTDPEPLPDGHPLWQLDNCIITSHTANPSNLERELFRFRIVENVTRFLSGQPLIGVVDPRIGY
jgi:phosphoglycerate dehydrogenase-like enzyme